MTLKELANEIFLYSLGKMGDEEVQYIGPARDGRRPGEIELQVLGLKAFFGGRLKKKWPDAPTELTGE